MAGVSSFRASPQIRLLGTEQGQFAPPDRRHLRCDAWSMATSALPNTSHTRLSTLEFVRRTAGLSRPELAERSGVSVATILASERFGRVPHLTTARRLGQTLNLAVDELFPEGEHDG
jgi:DNA-binding XRE family transcriptional regulator